MKSYLIIFLFLNIFFCHSQIFESFSDGDFTHNPEWKGTISNFKINDALQLQSNATGASTSYLFTPSQIIINAEWECKFKIDYPTSASNYACMYIISDSCTLENGFNGYFVQVGGTNDEVSLFYQNELKKEKIIDGLDKRIDSKTVEKYLSGLLDSLIIYQAKRYNIKGKQYLRLQEKYYLVDLGLRYMLVGGKDFDVGHILENVIYLELIRRGYEVYVGQSDKNEVDFVAMNSNGNLYIQASATVRDSSTFNREIKPLQSIDDNYPKLILTLDEDPAADYDGIKRINVLEWLLS